MIAKIQLIFLFRHVSTKNLEKIWLYLPNNVPLQNNGIYAEYQRAVDGFVRAKGDGNPERDA